jgi:hypothetical protein
MNQIGKQLRKYLGIHDLKNTRLVCKDWLDLFPLLKHCLPSPEAQYLSNLSFLDKITNLNLDKGEEMENIDFAHIFPNLAVLKLSTSNIVFHKFVNLRKLIIDQSYDFPNNEANLVGLSHLTNLVSLQSTWSIYIKGSFSNLTGLTKLTNGTMAFLNRANYIDNAKHLVNLKKYKGECNNELLEKLTNLTNLRGYYMQMEELKIAHLTKLTHLDVGTISSDQLGLLINLVRLECVFADRGEIDLNHLHKLKHLKIYNSCKLSNNSFINMKYLTFLLCYNVVIDGPSLSHLVNLRVFSAYIKYKSHPLGKSDPPVTEGIHHLINLKTLIIHNKSFNYVNLTGADFTKLPKLELIINECGGRPATYQIPLLKEYQDMLIKDW